MDGSCSSCKGRMVYCFREGENVCSTCGWTDPNLVYSTDPQVSNELSKPEKIHYVRKQPKGADLSRIFGNTERGSGNYHRPYYWHERFGQWRNQCPLIPQEHLVKIAMPLSVRFDDPDLQRIYNYRDELLLTREDIAVLCKHAMLKCHAEKWIQIKWRLCNYPLYKYNTYVWHDLPIPMNRLKEDPREPWAWKPNFLSNAAHEKLKVFAEDIQAMFLKAQSAFIEFPYMLPYKRKSFINFDFVMKRGLYMTCPNCDWDKHGVSDECWVIKFQWALKNLQTAHNIRNHVAWFYFLVREIAKGNQHEKTITVTKWDICPSDHLINNEKYRPKCPELLSPIIHEPLHPDLVPRPLKRLDTYSRPPLGLGVQTRRSDMMK